MNKQVPYATASDEKRIVDRLMCDGYSAKEIEAGFAVQAKDNGDFTVYSVREAIMMIKKTTEWPKHSTECPDCLAPSDDGHILHNIGCLYLGPDDGPLGEAIDSLDNVANALQLPLPDSMHVQVLRKRLPDIVNKLKTEFVAVTGNNPWKVGPE